MIWKKRSDPRKRNALLSTQISYFTFWDLHLPYPVQSCSLFSLPTIAMPMGYRPDLPRPHLKSHIGQELEEDSGHPDSSPGSINYYS